MMDSHPNIWFLKTDFLLIKRWLNYFLTFCYCAKNLLGLGSDERNQIL